MEIGCGSGGQEVECGRRIGGEDDGWKKKKEGVWIEEKERG